MSFQDSSSLITCLFADLFILYSYFSYFPKCVVFLWFFSVEVWWMKVVMKRTSSALSFSGRHRNFVWATNWQATDWPYGYGSIPISTIFRVMNIHLPAILRFTRGTRFWPIPIWVFVWNRVPQSPVACNHMKNLPCTYRLKKNIFRHFIMPYACFIYYGPMGIFHLNMTISDCHDQWQKVPAQDRRPLYKVSANVTKLQVIGTEGLSTLP